MYDPKGNGKEKAVEAVQFVEAAPPEHLSGVVHRFLDLRTEDALPQEYRFHALPDACTYIVFDQLNRDVTGVSKLRAISEEFNLGTRFHFVNIRLLPGVWQGGHDHIAHGLVQTPYTGPLPLRVINDDLQDRDFAAQQAVLCTFVETLVKDGLLVANPVTERIFQHVDAIHTVADMAQAANLSPRQLQRRLKATTGFAPHDFLKILRLQQILNGSDTSSYADQSHFIHSFRTATGYTPGKYAKKFET